MNLSLLVLFVVLLLLNRESERPNKREQEHKHE
jgi:hypothetical protein